jgi:hypothetical protein
MHPFSREVDGRSIGIQFFFDDAPKISKHAPPPISSQPRIGGNATVCVLSVVAVIGPVWRIVYFVV